MKIVVSSDWHGDHVTMGVRRFKEIEAAVQLTVDEAIQRRADAYVFAGDLTDPDSGSCVFRVLELAIGVARALEAEGIESHWLAGNHDVIEDGSGDTTLSPLRGLQGNLRDLRGLVHVYEGPGTFVRDGVRLAFLPFTATSHAYDPVEAVEAMLAPPHDERAVVVFGHLNLPGIIPGEETTEMPRGREVVFPTAAIRAAAGARKLVMVHGHYHQQQVFDGIHIPGSLARLTAGEEKHRPSFLVLEV